MKRTASSALPGTTGIGSTMATSDSAEKIIS